MKTLELVATQDLVNEFSSRFEDVIIFAATEKTKKEDDFYHHYTGRRTSCMGMCDALKNMIYRKWVKEIKED